jgi:ABC-type multidrug transport system fused ATPase/permease subunit
MFLSLSFITIIPLLKVMMGQEGLHGWVDRKQCEWRYGVEFYVPDTTDFTNNPDAAYQLAAIKVKKGGAADSAGIKPEDKIIGAGKLQTSAAVEKIPAAKLLEELAMSSETELAVQLKRPSKGNAVEHVMLKLPDGKTGFAAMEWGRVERMKWSAKMALAERAQKLIRRLPREQTKENTIKAIIIIILGAGILTVIRCVAKFYKGYLAEKVVQVGINRLRREAFAHVMKMPIGFFGNERPSDTVSRLVRDTGQMGNGIKLLLGKALQEPMNALLLLSTAMLVDLRLTLVFLIGAPPTLALVIILGKKMKKASKKSLAVWSQMLAKLQETMAGLKVVKVYNRQKYEEETFESINEKLLKQLLKISKVDAATMPVLEVLGMAAGSAALIAGASLVTDKKIEGQEFILLLILLGSAAEAIRKTSDIWNKMQEANAAAERVFAIMDRPVETEKPGAIELPLLKNKIEFRNVTFTYPGSKRPALKGINLVVTAGHNVAVVGPNGSGKTTLANLIPRFYDPDSGQILIDGTDIRDATLFSLRNQIGMVTQNVVTFNDTIAANIAYGKNGATREEIIEAAMRAFAHEFISPLPKSYNTVIGEQGTGLSGGQLQRIVIARAILKNPAILIFDEATSQVDADSEAKIHRAIEEIIQNRTCFVIAHRFSTIMRADVIVVMDDGRIIAQGRHEELIRSCQLYQTLYETQLIKG